MKTQHILITSILLALPVLAERLEINGTVIEIPDSEIKTDLVETKVGQVFRNVDVSAKVEEIKAQAYGGSAVGVEAKELAVKLEKEGPTDANLSALAALEQKLDGVEPITELPLVVPDPKRASFDAAVANGFDTGMGFRLGLRDADRNAFTQMLVLVNTAKEKGIITDATPQTIADMDGKAHTVTTGQFTSLMLAYGAHYKALWNALKEGN